MDIKKEIVDSIKLIVESVINKTCPTILFGVVANVGAKGKCQVRINNIDYYLRYYGDVAPNTNTKYPVFVPFNNMSLAFIISGGKGGDKGTTDYNDLDNRPQINGNILSGNQTSSQLGLQSEITSGTTSQYWRGDKTWQTLNKSSVGLGNVDNVRQYSESNPPPYPVTSVNNKTGNVSLNSSDVGALATTGGTMTGSINMGSNKITNVSTGTANTDAINKKQLDDAIAGIGTVFKFKGSVATKADLPSSGDKIGDVWYVESEQVGYIWLTDSESPTGRWEQLGPTIDLSGYLRKAELASTTGNSTTTAMTQKATTDELNIKYSPSNPPPYPVTSVNNKTGDITLTKKTIGSASDWSAGSAPTLGTAISADDITSWDAGSLPTLGNDITVKSVKTWSAGSLPTLGTAIPADDITGWNAGSLPTLGTAISADDITAWSAGTLPTLGTDITVKGVDSWNAGSMPTLGTAISADDITAWSAGTLPTLGTEISADDITSWNAGSAPSLTITSTACDDITEWTSNTPTGFSISGGTLQLTAGSSANLAYTAKSVGSASGWSAGSVPSLSYTAKSIPNVTGVGTLPSLSYTARSIPNVTSVGSAPSLATKDTNIPNVTGVGTLPSLSYTEKSIPNVTSVGTLPSLAYSSKSIPNVTGVGSLPSLITDDIDIPNVTDAGTLPSLSYTEKSIPNITGVGTLPSLTITNTTVGDGDVTNT